jgi:PHD/YefM family antitoxin component YafN of YafNO toxin-antitoxin module
LSQNPSTPLVHRIPMTQARINLGQLAKRAHVNNEYFILEKDGIPVIGIMDADELEDYLELRNPKIREQIRKSHTEFLAGKSRPAEELLAELQKATSKRARPASQK